MGQLGDLSPQGSIAVGIVVGLLSTSIQSLGLTLQRKSHLLEDEQQQLELRRPPYRRRRWQLGMFMFIISNIVGSTIQITTLPLPVLSTLQAAGLVFNTIFATLLLHEPFTRYSFIGTLLVCGGALLIGIYGAIGEPAHDLQQLLELLGRYQFIIWLVGTLLIVGITLMAARFFQYLAKKAHEQHEYSKEQERLEELSRSEHDMHDLTPSGIQKRPTLPLNIPVPSHMRSSRLRMLRGLAYALMSGILSAHSLLVAKSAVELLIRTLAPPRQNQFDKWQSWLILVALLFFALSQLYYLHCGLRLCSTSVLYPFVFCIYNVVAILDGLIYFNQSSLLTPLDGGLVALGTCILLAGVISLSWRLDETPPIAPATGPGTTDPEAPLGSPSEVADSPRLETSETSPLLRQRRHSTHGSLRRGGNRRPTLSLLPPHIAPPASSRTPTSAQIWAELDDSDDSDEGDSSPTRPQHLLQLPSATTSLILESPKKRRRRGQSLSSNSLVTPSKVSFADGTFSRRRSGETTSSPDRSSTARRVISAPHTIDNKTRTPAQSSVNTPYINPNAQNHENSFDPEAQTRTSSSKSTTTNDHRSWTSAPKRLAQWFYTDSRETNSPEDSHHDQNGNGKSEDDVSETGDDENNHAS